jgi:hypothetical protein
MEPLIRSLICGADIRPRPPNAYAALLRSLSGMANNLNQIAKIANETRRVSDDDIRRAIALVNDAWQLIKDGL